MKKTKIKVNYTVANYIIYLETLKLKLITYKNSKIMKNIITRISSMLNGIFWFK